jgi:hypothetical protein
VSQVGYLLELHQDARSTKHKILRIGFFEISVTTNLHRVTSQKGEALIDAAAEARYHTKL